MIFCCPFYLYCQILGEPIELISVEPFKSMNESFLVCDLNADRTLDFARGIPYAVIHFGHHGDGFYEWVMDISGSLEMYSGLDLNNDERADILNANGILQNTGYQSFSQLEMKDFQTRETFRKPAFLNADQLPELIHIENNPFYQDRLIVRYNLGHFEFSSELIDEDQHNLGLINTGDLEGDGDTDMIVISDQNDHDVFVVYENMGSRKFEKRMFAVSEAMNGWFIDLVDIDGDGDGDVLFSTNDGRVVVYINHAGAFDRLFEDIKLDVQCAVLSDLDDDGDQDLVALVRWENGIYSFRYVLNDSDGTFHSNQKILDIPDPGIPIFLNRNQNIIHFGDLNGDGREDLILQSPGEGKVYGVKLLDHPTPVQIPSIIDVSIYPNPSKDYLVFEHDLQFSPEVKIIDTHGRVVKSIKQNDEYIDISNLSPGILLLYWRFENGDRGFKKFVKR